MTIIDLSNHKLYTSTLRPMADVRCAILHTTGYGPGLERLDKLALAGKVADVGEAFAVRQVRILKYRPHYLVGRDGKIFQLMPHNTRAPHTGSGNMQRQGVQGQQARVGGLVHDAPSGVRLPR
jgi:N-acetyl-anhydromuramyl-L-alanine amidase AmpD